MDDKDRASLLRRARNVKSLSRNDLHELENIQRTGLKPFAADLSAIFQRAYSDDDAVLLKAAILGTSRLSANERFRLDEAMTRRGRQMPG